MARRMRVEYSESTGLVGKPQKSRDKEQPRKKEPEGKSEQDVDMHDSSTCKTEEKPRFDRKEDSDDGDDDVSKNVVLQFGNFPPKVAVNYVLPRVFGPKEGQPEELDENV